MAGEAKMSEPAGVQVTVEMDWDALEPGVTVALGPTSSTPPPGTEAYDEWVRGVAYGVRFAITQVSSMPCVVKVVEIRGDSSTTPTP